MADELTLIACALGLEARAVVRAVPGLRRERSPLRGLWRGPGVIVAQTGVGTDATRRALALLAGERVTRAASVGFCGSLVEALRVGAVVRPGEVTFKGKRFALADGSEFRLFTSPEPVHGAARQALAEAGYAVADMETGAVAEWACERGVAVSCVRAVTDAPGAELPRELGTISDGESLRLWGTLRALARRPGLACDIVRLARAAGVAGRALGSALKPPPRFPSLRP